MNQRATPSDWAQHTGTRRAWRVLMYVQHLSGIGHQHRSARIARALTAHGIQVTYVTGGMPVPGLDIGASEKVQLMPVRARDQRYQELLDGAGNPVTSSWKAARSAQLLAVLERSNANVVMLETYPFGRKLMRFELEPFVQRVCEMRPKKILICSVRDILEPRDDVSRYIPMADQIERYFDYVLVHSDPDLFNFADTFPLFERIRDKVIYTGYISEAGRRGQGSGALQSHADYCGAIIISVGGGSTGAQLLTAALEAKAQSQYNNRRWLLLAGPNFPEDTYLDLKNKSRQAGVEVQRNRSDFRELLRACQVSVSQAGYNTMLDILATGVRSVLVPFARYSEREQLVRARHLQALGLAAMVEAGELSPQILARTIDRVAQIPKAAPLQLDVAGSRYCAQVLLALLQGETIPIRGET